MFFKSARIPGRTCLASTTSKGGKSKSRVRGLASMDSSTAVAAAIDREESEEQWRESEGALEVDLWRVWRQKENEEDQRGQG